MMQPSISPDGRKLFVYRNSQHTGGDICVAKNRPSKEARQAVKRSNQYDTC